MTKNEILGYVKEAGLKPAEIVSMSYGLIPVTQAHDWLRTWKFSMSTTLLLHSYAAKKKDLGFAGIFQPPLMVEAPSVKANPQIKPDFTPISGGSKWVSTEELGKKAVMAVVHDAIDKKVSEIKKTIPSLKTASEIPAKQFQAPEPPAKNIERAIQGGPSHDGKMDMKYKIIPSGHIRFCCGGKWWQASGSMKECYAGNRLVKRSELTEIVIP